jgi:hypothetical protein
LAETTPNPIEALVNEARARLAEEITAQASQLESMEKSFQELRNRQGKLQEDFERQLSEFREQRKKLQDEIDQQLNQLAGQSMQELRDRHKKLEETVQQQLDQLGKYQPPVVAGPMDKLLNAVRNLITATLPDQVMETLTEEAEQMGVRAAVFDVRGKSAWGSSAHGFGPGLTEKVFRGVVVPLNQENPFRQAYETGGHVDATADAFRKNRNVLDKLKPAKGDTILLQPIRSAGSVSMILYTDTGGKETPLPVDAIKILSEFAGAQLDRLMALSGGGAEESSDTVEEEAAAPAEQEEVEAEIEAEAAPAAEEPAPPLQTEPEVASPPPVAEAVTPPAPDTPPLATSDVPAPAAVESAPLNEEEQKFQKDAKRFARLLVSEIDLYNKNKVADGRKNKDLYKRLKSDIERSRLTFQKRFSKPVGPPVDYFHEELIRSLANNDSSLMGPEYPGPSA